MPPIQITRAEYEKKFGVKPIASSTSILEDEKPAPLRITRAEWNALQEQWKPQEKEGVLTRVGKGEPAFPANTEGGAIENFARYTGNIPGATYNLARNLVAPVNPFDINHPLNIGASLSKGAETTNEIYSERGFKQGTKDIASGFLDTAKKGYELWKKAGESIYKNLEQNTLSEDSVAKGVGLSSLEALSKMSEIIINDPTLVPSMMYAPKKVTDSFGGKVTKTVDADGATIERNSLDEVIRVTNKDGEVTYGTPDKPDAISKMAGPVVRAGEKVGDKASELFAPLKKNFDERGVNNVVKEIDQIENKYVKTRNANSYSKDIEASQRRIAESNVLDGSVDNNGLLQTKVSGGAIDQYKAQTIDGYEDIVRRKLADTKETALFDDVGKALKIEIGRSGLEAADLVTALKKIEKELEGLRIRTKGSSIIDLAYLQDAKIATTKNINYLTPPEKATYRKAVARAYKVLIEKNSTKFDVKAVNEGPLARAYEDIARLERLDGARAEGGRLGKATASLAGTAIGMVAGSAGGPLTAAAVGVVGGELAQVMKGAGMSRTFKGGGKGLTPDPLLVQTKLSIADKPMKAKAGIAKTKEIKELESQIAKNVADQKKAIKTGDFALVQALKEIYVVLVDELRKAVKYINDNASVGLSIKKSVTPESVAKKADAEDMKLLASVIDDVKTARLDPDTNRILSNMGLGRATDDELVSFAKEVFDEKDGVANRVVQRKNEDKNALMSDQNQATNAPTTAQIIPDTVPPVGNVSTDLLEEAKKYKSAEEFVSKQPVIYHATDTEFDSFAPSLNADEMGTWFSPDSASVKSAESPIVMERYIKPGTKLINEKELSILENTDWYLNQPDPETALLTKGYQGIQHDDGVVQLLRPNEDTLTKSQLTEIWNKAQGNDLLAEARKYKSAEEFVKAIRRQSDNTTRSGVAQAKLPETYKSVTVTPEKAPDSEIDFLEKGVTTPRIAGDSKLFESHPNFRSSLKAVSYDSGKTNFVFLKEGVDPNKLQVKQKYEFAPSKYNPKEWYLTNDGGKSWFQLEPVDDVNWLEAGRKTDEELRDIWKGSQNTSL